MPRTAIFVPGFLGSDLHLGNTSLGEFNKIWLGIPTFLGGGYRLMDLDGFFPLPNGIPLQVGSALWAIYGDFLEWLGRKFERVRVVPWDWRFSAADAVPAVAQALREELSAGNAVVILGHSAGGRVAALAANTLFPNERVNLQWVVTVGTPWRGSWRGVEALIGRAESVHQGAALAAAGQFSIARYERFKIQKVLSSFQGLYELFPTSQIQAELSPPGAPDCWNPGSYDGIFQPVNAGKLAAGHAYAEANTVPDPSLPLINIIGVGVSTPGPFTPGDDFADSNLDYSLDGDGVVAVQSSRFVGPARVIILEVPGEHGRLCSAEGTLGALAALI